MSLSYSEKIRVLDSYDCLTKGFIKPDKTNYYFKGKSKRKVVVRELRDTGNGYIYAGYLQDYANKIDERGFINIDRHVNNEIEFRALIDRVISSYE